MVLVGIVKWLCLWVGNELMYLLVGNGCFLFWVVVRFCSILEWLMFFLVLR